MIIEELATDEHRCTQIVPRFLICVHLCLSVTNSLFPRISLIMPKSIWIAMIALPALFAQAPDISPERIRAHDRFLSSDLLEGRGVGHRGGDLATEYIATQFELAGAKPAGDNGTWFQKVPLVGVETQPDATLSATAAGKQVDFKWLDDFVGVSQTQQPDTQFDGQAVFVGQKGPL